MATARDRHYYIRFNPGIIKGSGVSWRPQGIATTIYGPGKPIESLHDAARSSWVRLPCTFSFIRQQSPVAAREEKEKLGPLHTVPQTAFPRPRQRAGCPLHSRFYDHSSNRFYIRGTGSLSLSRS